MVVMETLAEMGYIVATTDYRLNVSAMEQLKDCREAYAHFINELKKMNRPLKVAAYGSSAGAHLASLLSVAAPGASGDDFVSALADGCKKRNIRYITCDGLRVLTIESGEK